MLALVVVTMATPGVVGLDESNLALVLLEDSATSTPAELGADPQEAEIEKIVHKIASKANLQMSDDEKAAWVNEEAKAAAKKIRASEARPGRWAELLKKQAAKPQAKANGEKVEEDSASKQYHSLLTKLSTKAGIKLPANERDSWLASSATKLAADESAEALQSRLQSEAIAKAKAEAQEVAAKAAKRQLDADRVKKAAAKESQEKTAMVAAARSAQAMRAEEEKAAKAKAAAAAEFQAASAHYSEKWLRSKEAGAEQRKVEAQLTACRVKLDGTGKAVAKASAAITSLKTKKDALQGAVDAAVSGSDKQKLRMLQNKLAAGKKELASAKLAVETAKATHASTQEECTSINNKFDALKAAVKKLATETQQAKNTKEASKVAAAREASKAAALEQANKDERKGFEKQAQKATTIQRAIHIHSATHYCAMKKDPKTQQWFAQPKDFRGSDNELGNESTDAAKACNGKKKCDLQIPTEKTIKDCPQQGYVARFQCKPIDETVLALIQLGDDGIASLEGKVAKVSGDSKASDSIKGKLEALKSKSNENANEALLEAEMTPGKPVKSLVLSCPEPQMSASMKSAFQKKDAATKEVAKEQAKLSAAKETAKLKVEEKVNNAADAEAKAKAQAAAAKQRQESAANNAEAAKSKAADLEQKEAIDEAKPASKSKIAADKAKVAAEKHKAAANAEEARKASDEAEKAQEAVKAAEEKKKKAEAEAGAGLAPSPPASAEVKAAERKVDRLKHRIKVETKQLADNKKQLAKASDESKVVSLSAKTAAKLKNLKKAKNEEKKAEQEVEKAKLKAAVGATDGEREAAKAAAKVVAKAKVKKAALEAKEAVAGRNEKGEIQSEQRAVDRKIKEAEKVVNGDKQKRAEIRAAEARAEQEKARSAVDKARSTLNSKSAQLTQAKAELAGAKGAEQVLVLSGKVNQLAAEIKAAKEAVEKAERAEVSSLRAESASSKQVDAEEARVAKLNTKIADLKRQISTVKDPEQVKELSVTLAATEEEHKGALASLARAKAKQDKKDVRPQAKPSKAQEPQGVSQDKGVEKARRAEAAAEEQQRAALNAAKQVTQTKMKEAKDRLKAAVKADQAKADQANKKAEKAEQRLLALKSQSNKNKNDATELKLIKKNIIAGRDPLSGVESKEQLALKALKVVPRSALQVKQALQVIKSVSPGTGTCVNGFKCCVNTFLDTTCKVPHKKQCVDQKSASAHSPWQLFMSTDLQIGNAKTVSLETRWLKDPSNKPTNQGSFLRLRVCGAFIEGQSPVCFPKEGAGMRFEDSFGTPAGTCINAKDLAVVSKGGFKTGLEKDLKLHKSAIRARVDAQKVKDEARENEEYKQKIEPALMKSLVTELMELGEGELVSNQALLAITGSFKVSKTKA
jgi:hypothetical protein